MALTLTPLGGLGEIGMNCMMLEYEGERVFIDFGIQFPDASYPGIELLAPDFDYIRDHLDGLRGVIVTHGHDDHIGAIPYLARETDLDVFCTPFPEGLLRNKFSEVSDLKEVRFHRIVPGKPFQVGPFKFEAIPVQHSIIESMALAIETPVGNIIHSGDFKDDAIDAEGKRLDFAPFKAWGKRGVHLLLSDSTNAEQPGHTLSEGDIKGSFEQILGSHPGRILIALFASNIRRVENLIWIAKKLGRKVAFCGRSMHTYTKLAHDQSSLKLPEDTLVPIESIQKYPDSEVVILATGSQAEPQSALVRIAHGNHRDVQLKRGDLVVMSSRFIPGNERAISAMIDHLYRAGADVLYEAMHQIHVSGHGFQDELESLIRACNPKSFIPVHGEYRHLKKHAMIARSCGVDEKNILVIENGQSVEVTPKGIELGESLELRKTALVEGALIHSEKAILQQRSNLARTGIVFSVLLRDKKSQKLIHAPAVSCYGLLLKEGADPEQILWDAEDVLEETYKKHRNRPDISEVLRIELRRLFKKNVSHKPVVIPMILDV